MDKLVSIMYSRWSIRRHGKIVKYFIYNVLVFRTSSMIELNYDDMIGTSKFNCFLIKKAHTISSAQYLNRRLRDHFQSLKLLTERYRQYELMPYFDNMYSERSHFNLTHFKTPPTVLRGKYRVLKLRYKCGPNCHYDFETSNVQIT